MIDGKKVYVKEKIETTRTLSPTSVNYCLRILSSIMNAAVKWEYLHSNPVKLVKRLKQAKYKNHVPSKEEMKQLIDKADGMAKTVILFSIASGMRLGEILGAKWKFLDLDKGTYSVNESYSEFGLDKPKTDASFRVIHLPASLIHELKKHKLKTGGQSKEGLIFHAGDGEYIDPHNFRNRIYYPLLDKAELPRTIRFHDLRGLCATLLLESGASLKHVMEHLGHRSPNMTLGVYASVSEEAREEVAQKLEARMFG